MVRCKQMSETKDALIGTEIAGCRVISKIGEGGMGHVYKAHHVMLDKEVCLKLLAPDLAKDERYVQFFLREARSVAKLDHPNIVQVYNTGRDPVTGQYFLAMTYIQGKPLSDLIASTGPLALELAQSIAEGILHGLSAAHAQSIIHRDIKPSNILITEDGTPKIVDFGLARSVNEEKQLTAAGEMVGTAYFMAPEQGLGNAVDHRADLYALGGTFFYMLSSRYPFDGKTAIEVVHKHISSPPPNILKYRPDTPLHVARVIEKLLNKKPEERFQSAKETLLALSKNAGPSAADDIGMESSMSDIMYASQGRISLTSISVPSADEMQELKAKIPQIYSMAEDLEDNSYQRHAKAPPPPPPAPKDKEITLEDLKSAKGIASAPPPPPPVIPSEGLQIKKSVTSGKCSTFSDMETPSEPLKDTISAVLLYLAMSAGGALVFMALGAFASSLVPQDMAGLLALAEPWKTETIPPNQLVIASLGVLLLVLAAVRNKSLLSVHALLLLPIPLAAYASAMSVCVPQPALALSAKLLLCLTTTLSGIFSAGPLPYLIAVTAAAMVLSGAALHNRDSKLRIAAAAAAALSLPLAYFCAAGAAHAAAAPAAAVFFIIAALFTAAGAALAFLPRSSALTAVAIACYAAALIFNMGYISSPKTTTLLIRAAQENAESISKAKSKQEALREMGKIAEAAEVKVPVSSPALDKKHASSLALAETGLDFYSKSQKTGGLLLLALLLAALSSIGYFFERRRTDLPTL